MTLPKPIAFVWAASILLPFVVLWGQAQVSPTSAVRAAPVNLLYRTFFGQIAHLDQVATDVEKQGKNGTGIRDYYKTRLKLSDAEYAALRAISFSCDTAVKAQDQAAKALITNTRVQFAAQLAAQHSMNQSRAPTAPPELTVMQAQRDTIILSHINRLKTEVGAAGAQKVDNFVNTAFARINYVSFPPVPVAPPGTAHSSRANALMRSIPRKK